MEILSQNAKEQLAMNILKEFGCFDEAKRIASKDFPALHTLSKDGVEYITNRYITALEMIDEVWQSH